MRQILAPGNVDNDLTDSRVARLDLLTLEDNGDGTSGLWLLHGDTAVGIFDTAIPLGTADWRNLDLIAPGDATGDGLPDLWARDRVTGKLYQYASRTTTNPTTSAVTVARGKLTRAGGPVRARRRCRGSPSTRRS
ncbi:hypothetical protein ACIRL2_50320 [Embleya sp. NPDC127516]|uniref:hypothetical protein n=1 Tax=Embleya sp. NPDC127516 TaxID=3363990 RepID=UPI00381F32DB